MSPKSRASSKSRSHSSTRRWTRSRRRTSGSDTSRRYPSDQRGGRRRRSGRRRLPLRCPILGLRRSGTNRLIRSTARPLPWSIRRKSPGERSTGSRSERKEDLSGPKTSRGGLGTRKSPAARPGNSGLAIGLVMSLSERCQVQSPRATKPPSRCFPRSHRSGHSESPCHENLVAFVAIMGKSRISPAGADGRFASLQTGFPGQTSRGVGRAHGVESRAGYGLLTRGPHRPLRRVRFVPGSAPRSARICDILERAERGFQERAPLARI